MIKRIKALGVCYICCDLCRKRSAPRAVDECDSKAFQKAVLKAKHAGWEYQTILRARYKKDRFPVEKKIWVCTVCQANQVRTGSKYLLDEYGNPEKQ